MASNVSCQLCMNVPKKNAITKINALPKTFLIILEEMGGRKFSKADLHEMVICMKCLNFLKNMDNSSCNVKSNKISAAGKERVYKLMEKKRVPAAEAIEIVLAEERAKQLLIESGFKTADEKGNLLPVAQPNQVPNSLKKPRLSGAQRKKVAILIDAGMAPEVARQLIYAATLAKQGNLDQMTNMQVPNEERPARQRRPRQRKSKGAVPQNVTGQKNNLPQGGAAQTGKPNATQKTPVQRVAPVTAVEEKTAPAPTAAPKVPNQKGPAKKKPTISPGILVPLNKRQNNQPGGRGANSDKRVGAIVAPRRNDRPAPYNTNRQQNLSQRQSQSQQLNIFNQQQQNVSFEVGIVPINYPNIMLDNLKLDALKEAITNEILKIPQGGPLIRFLGTSSQDGWLKIICADELSHKWLAMLVSRWERAGVRMVEGNAMPQPAILSFYLEADFRSPDEILSIIEKQNNSLNANQWRVINRESDGNGQRITVCVDEQCFQALRSRDFMVFLGLGVVELKPRRSASDNVPLNSNNSSSQNFGSNDNINFLNSNNMQVGRGGGVNNYQSMNSGRGNGNGGGSNNYQNQGMMGQGYQRGGNQRQMSW